MTIYFSASSIKDMLACSMMYFNRRYHKDKAVETTPLVVGKIVHEAIEIHSESREKALNLAKNKFEWYNLTKKDEKLVESHVNSYFDNFKSLTEPTDEIERFFKFRYSDGVYIVGKWDRISSGDVLWDWKTTKRPPSNIDKDPQFIIYNEAYYQEFGKYPSAILYGALATGKIINFNPVDKFKHLLFEEYIPSMLDRILAGDFVHEGILRYDYPCKRCLYQEYCFEQLGK